MLKRLPPFLRNRYILVICGFVVYIGFFDTHDLISQIGIRMEVSRITDEIEYLERDTENAKNQIYELTSDREELEKFAREQYRMKRENEEIFVLLYE